MRLESAHKKALNSCIYKLKQLKTFLVDSSGKTIDSKRKFVALSCIKSIVDDFSKCFDHFKSGHIRDLQIYLRILFEMNCTFNYLMLSDDEEIQFYQDYSLLISYRDLSLYIYYGILPPDFKGENAQKTLDETIFEIKCKILDSGILKKLKKQGINENLLEMDRLEELAGKLKASHKSVHQMKERLKADIEFSGHISAAYFSSYNIPSQMIHGHWYQVHEHLFDKASTIFDDPFTVISFLNLQMMYLAIGMKNSGLISAENYQNALEQIMSITNTRRSALGLSWLTKDNFEAGLKKGIISF